MSSVESLSPEERRAYDLIVSRGELTQSELWKELDADSRKGSRLATALAEQGLIEREETTRQGRRTYLLRPTDGDGTAEAGGQADAEAEPEAPSGGGAASENESEGEAPVSRGAEAGGTGADAGRDLAAYDDPATALVEQRGELALEEFARELDVDAGTAEAVAARLEERGVLQRERRDGREVLEPVGADLDYSLLMAGDMISPLVPGEEVDPVESDEFTEWILRLPGGNG